MPRQHSRRIQRRILLRIRRTLFHIRSHHIPHMRSRRNRHILHIPTRHNICRASGAPARFDPWR